MRSFIRKLDSFFDSLGNIMWIAIILFLLAWMFYASNGYDYYAGKYEFFIDYHKNKHK